MIKIIGVRFRNAGKMHSQLIFMDVFFDSSISSPSKNGKK